MWTVGNWVGGGCVEAAKAVRGLGRTSVKRTLNYEKHYRISLIFQLAAFLYGLRNWSSQSQQGLQSHWPITSRITVSN